VKLSVHCHISQDYQLEYTNDPATNKKKPKFRLYSTHEQITLIHEDYGAGGILFTFTGGKVVNVGLNGNSLPDFLGHPILSKYENGKYDGEQAITDLVEYVKQIGLK